MGASASIDLSTKENILGVKDVKDIMSAVQINTSQVFTFDNVYVGLRTRNSGVSRNELLCILADKCEQEVFVLFLKHCGCEMVIDQFLGFCRQMKLLSRRDFTVDRASQLFHSKAIKSKCTNEANINYRGFRFDILPEIASVKGRNIREMVNKLCWTVQPTSDEMPSEDNTISRGNPEGNMSIDDKAAMCIQNFYRGSLARRRVVEEREIQYLEGCPSPISAAPLSTSKSPGPARDKQSVSQKLVFSKIDLMRSSPCGSPAPGSARKKYVGAEVTPTPSNQDSIPGEEGIIETEALVSRCNEIFLTFCTNGSEMTSHDFVRFCYDTALIPFEGNKVDFTAMQARHVFRRVVALHFDPERNVYDNGVVFGKRVSFDVFWRVMLPDVAGTKNQKLLDIVTHICNNHGIKRMYANNEGPPVVSLLSNREYMNSRCDSFESIQHDM
jgi:hypothetical protein